MSAPATNAAAPPIKLKIRTAAGDFLITDGLTKHSSWAQLQRKIESVCGVPVAEQQLSASYPPPARVITAAPHATLAELKIMSNDLLILKQVAAALRVAPAAAPAAAAAASPSPAPPASAPVRAPSTPNAAPPASLDSLSHLVPLYVQPIPNDNSCLFNSVNFLMEGVMSPEAVTELRQTVAAIILADADDRYNEAFLGDVSKETYTRSILQPHTWGGGIELSILADFFDVEIAALDTESCHQYVFGQTDEAAGPPKTKRIYLVFYGVHYDALIDTERHPPQRIFHPADSVIASRALLAARRLQAAGAFTNVSKFTLRCTQCKAGMVGAVEAQDHAKATGHANFEEYSKA